MESNKEDCMNWIRPGSGKRKIKYCEFCKQDVTTPYKGIHDGVQIFMGMPVKCPNNGKLNVHIEHGYRWQDKPKEGFKWFVEHKDTHLWWSGYKWTNDPNEAFGCEFQWTADRYARFQRLENYIVTEHEFVNQPVK
jgi:hypothetical protein